MKFVQTMAVALCLGLALAQGSLWADGVTRSVEPMPGGCKVTLSWAFSVKVESDLVIEERFTPGWSVDDATVPFGSLDATWFSGNVARFAVKNSLLAAPGSISFTVKSGADAVSGTVAGDWQAYLGGLPRKGAVAGNATLAASALASQSQSGGAADSTVNAKTVEMAVSIASFKVLGGSLIELSYKGLAKTGTLVVEGCEGLGKTWTKVKRVENAPAGDGKVTLTQEEAGACRFYRMKLLTTEE